MLAVFTLTVFVSASLLFVVQPMVGKMILPHLGGSSAVWTTCMLFFQAALLAGYIYAHFLSEWFDRMGQVWAHLVVMSVTIGVALPLGVPTDLLRSDQSPAGWLLIALVIGVGAPLLVVSSTAPLFQRWFSYTDHPDAADPYHLYAASNVGSMLALFGYPLVVERTLYLDTQKLGWSLGFAALTGLAVVCGIFLYRRISDGSEAEGDEEASMEVEIRDEPVTWWRRGRWVLWAFLPSSLMLGVTDHLTVDLAPVPLLWVLPLGLYLLSFILVFARRPIRLPQFTRAALPLYVFALLLMHVGEVFPWWIRLLIHLGVFLILAVWFHGELAADRPETGNLTEYFIWMSFGGALGGLFNALVAPAIFDARVEYFGMLAVAVAVVVPNRQRTEEPLMPSWPIPTMFALVGLFYLYAVGLLELGDPVSMLACISGVLVCAVVAIRQPRFENVFAGAVIAVGLVAVLEVPNAVDYERSFFGSYTIIEAYDSDEDTVYRRFSHGTTSHGVQAFKDGEPTGTPLGYHHPTSPVGEVLQTVPNQSMAVLGLGAGALAEYAEEGKHMTFYEIDPVVHRIAKQNFEYLDRCGDRCTVRIGDGRQLMGEESDDKFDVIVLDAYNSDSVPTHLLTRQSIEDVYLPKLADDGVLVFHTSNRYLDIEGVVGRLAEELDLATRTRLDHPGELADQYVYASKYTVVARKPAHLREILDKSEWEPTERADVVWTDDFTNLVSIMQW